MKTRSLNSTRFHLLAAQAVDRGWGLCRLVPTQGPLPILCFRRHRHGPLQPQFRTALSDTEDTEHRDSWRTVLRTWMARRIGQLTGEKVLSEVVRFSGHHEGFKVFSCWISFRWGVFSWCYTKLNYEFRFLYWKPMRCTISNIYLVKYSTCFRQVHCPSSGVSQNCIHNNR